MVRTHMYTRQLYKWKLVSNINPTKTNVRKIPNIHTILVPCQNRFTAIQYEANQGTVGMALPLLMKAL